MNSSFLLYLIPLTLGLCSCSSHLLPSDLAYASAREAGSSPSSKSNPSSRRVLLKSGSMSLEVEDVAAGTRQVTNLVKQGRGQVLTMDSDKNDRGATHLELTIPSDQLEKTMDQIGKLGKITSRRVHTRDVTDQWIDLQAKINNTRALRNRLRELLQASTSVEDTLKVERELARVQAELDTLEGTIKAITNHKAYSKLSVSITKKSIPGPVGFAVKGTWWGVKKLFVIQ
ncbi:DUF4349 domain-containing protein [Verrucomicrobiaceae bacterium N1E253]|uniref:DUF4349 domain-containing protein n=1 Tax=Oceaniferula marina TaxID=2748318 RepID=A0A851GHI6_9BACT|nr:DUF4349 domain-containing protein [Oceaniferula marina]NWK56342.1 DUF4349 domain-containing protein [Oceaniferula marina]